tara:strand:+ start:51 stop:743 length:693 start_codon:yes stop_codon:yes gene_type:complete
MNNKSQKLNLLTYIFRKIKRKINSLRFYLQALISNKKIIYLNKHKNYSDYLKHQKDKTTNPEKIKIWLGKEWDIKYYGFLEIFKRNKQYLKNKKKALCLGSRTGQEVKALYDLGIDALGIDLVPFPPYTIEGDIHNINIAKNSIDLIFTNIVDHSLYPERFCSEMARVCKKNGHIIIHLQKGIDGDNYSENMIQNPDIIIRFFDDFELCENRKIKNSFDLMNWEIILKKN